MPGMNQKNMKKMMKSLGVKQVDLDAEEVIIRLKDVDLVIHNPMVAKVTMMGQVTYQVVGTAEERPREPDEPEITDEDIEMVLDQVDVSEEEARAALLDAEGDIAKAIIALTGEEEGEE